MIGDGQILLIQTNSCNQPLPDKEGSVVAGHTKSSAAEPDSWVFCCDESNEFALWVGR